MIPREHFRTYARETPFHPRLAPLAIAEDWYVWSGFRAVRTVRDAEMEYFAIRNAAALFDISPLVKYRIEGPGAEAFLDRLTLRDVTKLAPGRVQYTAWCDGEGQLLDDGTLFRLAPDRFRLCAQGRHLPWLLDSAAGFDVSVREETEEIAGLALQGPTAAAVLARAGVAAVTTLRPFGIAAVTLGGVPATLSRTGFTGDLGYELFVAAGDALPLWDALVVAGTPFGLTPIGWAALDRARIEAGFLVSGTDFVPADHALRADRARRPDEAGLGWMVDPGKSLFNGRRAILAAGPPRRRLVGLEIAGNVPAEGAILYHRQRREAGIVTSALWSPMLKKSIAIASLAAPCGGAVQGDLWAEIYALRELEYRKLMKPVRIVPRPFLRLPRAGATPPGMH